MRMAMAEHGAEQHASSEKRLAMSYRVYCLVFFIITVATVSNPALVKADLPSPPSTLLVYDIEDRSPSNSTIVAAASPSGNLLEFGTIVVLSNPLREGATGDSPLLGQIVGQVTVEKDLSPYLSIACVLNTPSYTGTITAQGVTNSGGDGEVAITGGTGDFRFARGDVEINLITEATATIAVYKTTFYLKYD